METKDWWDRADKLLASTTAERKFTRLVSTIIMSYLSIQHTTDSNIETVLLIWLSFAGFEGYQVRQDKKLTLPKLEVLQTTDSNGTSTTTNVQSPS